MKSHTRVLVIGGGAVGASCLYHLTQAGVTDCLLIEKNELTSGSTWHAAGNIPTYATSWLGMRAGNYAWDLYKDLGDKVGSPITYRHTGAFWPTHHQKRLDYFHHLAGQARSAGFDLNVISPSEMEAMHPYYRAGDSVIAAIHDPYEGDIDPSQLTQALAKGARSAGAEVMRFTSVTGFTRCANGEWQVHTDKGTVQCEVVVNASGFYGAEVAKMAGLQVPVATLEHQYLVTESLPALEEDTAIFPLVRDPDIRFYLRRERAGFLFGSYAHEGRPAFLDGIPNDFAHGLFPDSVDDIAEVLEAAMDHVPLLAECGVKTFVNGPIAYSPDAQPLCGPAYQAPNFYHACGIQVGITQSAAVGKSIAEWVTEGETEWDLSAWDPRRFGHWASVDYAVQRASQLYDYQYAIPYPRRLLDSGRPLQQTSLYDSLVDKGAVMGQIGAWERALWFAKKGQYHEDTLSLRDDEHWRADVADECRAVRDGVGVMDHGGFSKFEVTGAGARAYLDRVFCGKLPKQGRVKLSYMLTPKGKIWGEATIACLAEDHYLLCGPTLAVDRDHDWLAQFLPEDGSVALQKGSERSAALMLMGPKSRDLLSQLTEGDLSREQMPWMSVAELDVAGCPVWALRVSYVGELGWELHLREADLATVYQAIQSVGAPLGLVDFASYALNVMRLEKGYHAWGSDFGCEYTLYEADLARFADKNKTDFVGREAFVAQQDQRFDWGFIGLELPDAEADPLANDPIFRDGEWVGYVTSGGMGFRCDKRLAMGYVKRECLDSNASYYVRILGRDSVAQPATMPFYDPKNERLKA